MTWQAAVIFLGFCWLPLLIEGDIRGVFSDKSRTTGWAGRAIFLVYLFTALVGTVFAVPDIVKAFW
jgi:hypothetical protein